MAQDYKHAVLDMVLESRFWRAAASLGTCPSNFGGVPRGAESSHHVARMGKARAARRDQRHAKRDVAKASRPTKYAKQKGGAVGKTRRWGGASTGMDEAPMAVIRDGQAVWAGGEGPAKTTQARAHVEDDDEHGDDRFSSAQKKLRALKKKIRHVLELKKRRQRGEELNSAQQMLLRTEQALKNEAAGFENEAFADPPDASTVASNRSLDDAADDETTAFVDEPPAGHASGSRLEQRRALKRQRHLEQMERKRLRKEAS